MDKNLEKNPNKHKAPNIIGSLIFSAFLPVSALLLSSCVLFAFIIKEDGLYKIARFWAKSSLIVLKALTGLTVQYENVPKNFHGQIIASEHQSTMEILALVAIIPRPIFILKKSLMFLPFFGWCLKYLGMVAVERKKHNAHWMKQAQTQLAKGKNILIFPEGTRTKFGSNTQYKSGVFRLSNHLNQPIIPVAIDTGKFWPRKSLIKQPGIAKIIFGKPIKGDADLMRKYVNELIPR